jgi:hypothetical protein
MDFFQALCMKLRTGVLRVKSVDYEKMTVTGIAQMAAMHHSKLTSKK